MPLRPQQFPQVPDPQFPQQRSKLAISGGSQADQLTGGSSPHRLPGPVPEGPTPALLGGLGGLQEKIQKPKVICHLELPCCFFFSL